MSVILSIDQSTSATKGMIWSLGGTLLARADMPRKQRINEKGWIEDDPNAIYSDTLEAVRRAIEKAGVRPEHVTALGISNQRETAVCWDRKTGQPLHHAISWQCARARDMTDEMERQGLAPKILAVTGLPLSPYFSAAKFGWMMRNVPDVAKAKENGSLCCGTVDSWLVFKLTGRFKTDYSNASRTQLLNMDTLEWDAETAHAFGLDVRCLPEICHSDSLFGYTDLAGLLPRPIALHGVLGDSHAALFGNRCFEPYAAKVTYGTGSSVMMNAGAARPRAGEGIATSLAWGIGGQVQYVLEGNINYAGAVTKWLAEDIGLIACSGDAGALAQTVADTGGVYLVPAFTGLGAPYFNSDARAAFLGMNRGTNRAHLVRAAEECIAYQVRDVVEAMNACCGHAMQSLCADGGPTRDPFLMQFQADVLGIPLMINETEELSGMGAAWCAAIGAGLASRDAAFGGVSRREITPQMDEERRAACCSGWREAVRTINGRV